MGTWAPGRAIVFARTEYGNGAGGARGIYIVNSDGTGLRKVRSTTSAPGGEPEIGGWSPDSELILYVLVPLKGVTTVRPDDLSVRRLTRGSDFDPAWSRDGLQAAFARFASVGSRGNGIWVVGRDGGGAHRVASAHGHDEYWQPSWAPR